MTAPGDGNASIQEVEDLRLLTAFTSDESAWHQILQLRYEMMSIQE